MYHPVFNTGSRRIKPAVAGSIPAFSAIFYLIILSKEIKKNSADFTNLLSVDKILNIPEIKTLLNEYGRKFVLFSIRNSLNYFRTEIINGKQSPSVNEILIHIKNTIITNSNKSLKKVINATGIIIHTNLGRAPFGEYLIKDSFNVLKSYNNLEYNLQQASRGNRNDHTSELIKYLTGAEDAIIVNNNAAAVMFLLHTFAKNKEVIVSRGELIEIGGSFRIPDIMAASDCKMVEVGTTNKTNIDDYKNAINDNTSILFKAHKSNYQIKGFTKEVQLDELVQLSKKHKIPLIYDLGSGLLQKSSNKYLINEPTVKDTIKKGVDIVCFSGDKLLGGPQAGIIVGKKKLISNLKKEPMLRALRVCKTTIALLETSFTYYLNEKELIKKNFIFSIFNRKPLEIKATAQKFSDLLKTNNIDSEIVSSIGQTGGGTVPDGEIPSFSVKLLINGNSKECSNFAEKIYSALLHNKQPVLAVLKKGYIYFDMLTIFENELNELTQVVCEVINNNKQ